MSRQSQSNHARISDLSAEWARAEFVTDATILSQTWPYKPDGRVRKWIARTPADRLLVPMVVLDVINQGIFNVQATDPDHAEELLQWRNSLIASGMKILPPCDETADVAAAIIGTKPLKNLWMDRRDSKRTRIPESIWVAATSIVCGSPIATMKIRDYQTIGHYFPLPGIFDPQTCTWRSEVCQQAPIQARRSSLRRGSDHLS